MYLTQNQIHSIQLSLNLGGYIIHNDMVTLEVSENVYETIATPIFQSYTSFVSTLELELERRNSVH
jgi:N-formylglutamate amidohydrolase